MKKWFPIFIFLNSINFASSQGISDILNSVDSSSVLLLATFAISFSILFFALSKFFKQNQAVSGAISGAISFLIVYQINQSGLSLENFFFDLGVSEDILFTIIPVLILGAMIFTIIKFAKYSLLIIGGFFLVLSFLVYEKIVFAFIGIILIVIKLFFIPKDKWNMKKENKSHANSDH
jgi:hypothetical protein